MYRYCVDNAETYTSEDFVLFRESAFACWMERLTLENPDHGIPPDVGSKPPGNYMECQDDLGATLRSEGKDVCIVDWDAEEPIRRNNTLEAMRRGIDFIVNGQLALGPLSGSANLLMRTSGYSELGNFLYIPCDTQAKTTMNSAFRLCFLADLLHSLQGQLPPQLLIIRGGSDLLPLKTEDHIYHYRAVKQRFMATMASFRKHRMPDPVDSSHFGRWSDCANEVLKQRALRGDEQEPDTTPREIDNPLPQVASATAAEPFVQETPVQETLVQDVHGQRARAIGSKGLEVSGTLADQARMLQGDLMPASTENQRKAADAALQNLEFIGSERRAPSSGLRAPRTESRGDAFREQEPEEVAEPTVQPPPHPLDSPGFSMSAGVDRDEVSPREVSPSVLNTDGYEFEVDCIDDSDYQLPGTPSPEWVAESQAAAVEEVDENPEEVPIRPFSSSLNTSGTDQD